MGVLELFQDVLIKDAIQFQIDFLKSKEISLPLNVMQSKINLSIDITSKFISLLLKTMGNTIQVNNENVLNIDTTVLDKINSSINNIKKIETAVLDETDSTKRASLFSSR